MAALGRIRQHGVLLLIIVGLAMLAFILGDFFTSGSSYFNHSREFVGEVEGTDIHVTDFEKAKDQLTEVYKIETGRSDFDEETASYIRTQVWQSKVIEAMLKKQTDMIGMNITPEELYDICCGKNPHQLIQQRRAFYDETGQFNPQSLARFIASLDQMPEEPEQQANFKQAKSYWLYWENAVRLTYMQEKYTNLLAECLTANSLDIEFAQNAAQKSHNVEFVMLPYTTIADSAVTVSKSEIKSLYNKRKHLYKQEPNRAINYIAFDIVPSEQDFKDAEKWINALKDEFATTEELAAVVNSNSDIIYDGLYYSENTIPAQYKDFAFGKDAKAGNVTDITFDNNTFAMARLVECNKMMSDSLQLRITYLAENKAEAIDSVKAAWAAGDTKGAQETGWVTEAMIAPQSRELSEKAFAGAKGSIFTVEAGTGIQVVEILDKSVATPKAKVAILSRLVTPSSKTEATIYNEAKQFIINNNTPEKFEAAAAEKGMQLIPAENLAKSAERVNDLKQSRTIVHWMFEAEDGEISDVFTCGNRYVVAEITEINDGEYASLEAMTPQLRQELTKKAKADRLIAKIAQVNAKDMNTLAGALGVDVQMAEGVNFNTPRFAVYGAEPAVNGTVAMLADNAISEPIAGNAGVYVVKVDKAVVAGGTYDVKSEIANANARTAYSVQYQALGILQDKAEITDNRANFY